MARPPKIINSVNSMLSTFEKFDEAGLTEDLSIQVLKDCHEASNKFKDKQGNIIKAPDWRTRLDAAKIHLAMRGYMTERHSVEGRVDHYINELTDEQLLGRILDLAGKAGIVPLTEGEGPPISDEQNIQFLPGPGESETGSLPETS